MAKKVEPKPELAWRIVGGLTAVAAGMVARKAVEFVWTRATGDAPPESPENPDIAWGQAIAFAVASGVAIGVARLVMTRQAINIWKRATGELPVVFRQVEDALD